MTEGGQEDQSQQAEHDRRRASPATEVGEDLHLGMVERTISLLNQGAAGCGAGGEEDEPQILAQGVYFKWGSCGFGVPPPLPACLTCPLPRRLPTSSPRAQGTDSRIRLGSDPVTGACRGRRCHSQGCSARSNRKLPGGPKRRAAAGYHPGKGQKCLNKWHTEDPRGDPGG